MVESDEGDGSDMEIAPPKKGKTPAAPAKKATALKGALEIEKPTPPKFKNDKNKHKDEFKAPLLD